MKKVVLTFGLIAGAVLSAMLTISITFWDRIGFERGEILGYSSMVASFLLIFFGVKSYRDTVAGGSVKFGRAFGVGMLIAVVAAVCYSATWQVLYRNVAPDFMTNYQAHQISKLRSAGEGEAAIAAKEAEYAKFAEMYRNPAINAAITFMEPLPVALIVALVSAGVLSRPRSRSRSREAQLA